MKKVDNIGEKINFLIQGMKVKQVEISNSTGISTSQLNKFLNGNSELNSQNLIKLLCFIGIDINEIINKKIAKIGNFKISSDMNPGESFEVLINLMNKTEKKAAIEHLSKISSLAVGPSAKNYINNLKQLL